jgi:hypothetical protein
MVRTLSRGVFVLGLFALAGCGVLGSGSQKQNPVSPDDLARMVVPKTELGPGLDSFEVDLEDSGRESAAKAAEGTVDPKDTAKSMRRRGWLDGYLLSYSNPDVTAAGAETGLLGAQTGTDLFKTESAARAVMLGEAADFEHYRGKMLEGAKLERVDVFDAGVGDEGVGIGLQARAGKKSFYVTGVLFRHGRILGSAAFSRTDKTVMRADALRLAQKLDERIESVLAGELLARPLPPSVDLDPVQLVLTKADLPTSSRIVRQGPGFGEDGAQASYARQFDLGSVHLGSSIIRSVRAEVRVYKTVRSAAAAMQVLSGRKSTKAFVREFARGVRMGGFEPRNLRARPIRLQRYPGMDVSFKAPLGRFETVLFVVRVGRAVQAVAVYGYDKDLRPEDGVVFVQKAHARMKRVLAGE